MDIALAPTQIDHFRMLGLGPSAQMEAVQGAYRVLARHLRPDISGDPSTAEAMADFAGNAGQLVDILV